MNFGESLHNSSIMKSFSVLLVLILTACGAVAQTDTNTTAAPADANAPAAPSAASGVAAQPDTNAIAARVETSATATQTYTNTVGIPTNTMASATTHPMSLQDCIQEALKHNLDVQISRFNPQIQLFNLNGAYSIYDPTFDFNALHQRNNTGPEFENGLPIPASTSDQNTFTPDLSGFLPWGMTYDLNGTITDSKNINFSFTTNIANPFTNRIDQGVSGSAGVTLTQPLLKNFWIDSSRLQIKLAKNQLQQDEQGLRLQLITSITAVENAYYELVFAQENLKVQQEALVLAQTQLDQDRQRVQIGTLSPLDVQQDEAQVATSRAALIGAQYTLANNQNTLKNLLTDQYRQWHGTDVQPTESITNAPLQLFDLQDSWTKGLTQRPDLIQSRLKVEAQGIQLKFDRN
jgi:outer membrane protein TolC